jgi:periplasmic protein TonB
MAAFYSEGVYRVGGGVSVPRVLSTHEPEYTAEARAAEVEGSVGLVVTIGENGRVRDIQVQTSLGYGLDEKAIECVQKWRFRAGELKGEPVPVAANLSVGFSLRDRKEHRGGDVRVGLQIDGE